jgi:hypothetical protein
VGIIEATNGFFLNYAHRCLCELFQHASKKQAKINLSKELWVYFISFPESFIKTFLKNT